MSNREFLAWHDFYKAQPFDDFHRFHRPAALVAQTIGGGDMQARLNWLQPDPAMAGMTDADAQTLAAFGFTRKG